MTLGLIRVWAPEWSPNGTHGMVHAHGNLKNSHRCTDIRSVDCATGYMDGARCLVRLCLLGQPCQQNMGVWSTDNVNEWILMHSSTIAWYMDVTDSSYIVVCYDCLWLIDHLRVLISLFYDRIVRFLTEFKGLRRGRMLNGTMSADGQQCSCACFAPPGEIYGL